MRPPTPEEREAVEAVIHNRDAGFELSFTEQRIATDAARRYLALTASHDRLLALCRRALLVNVRSLNPELADAMLEATKDNTSGETAEGPDGEV